MPEPRMVITPAKPVARPAPKPKPEEKLPITPGNTGGARPNSGPKPKGDKSVNDAYKDLAIAKEKRERYRADITELEFLQRKGNLVDVKEVQKEWVQRVQIAKSRLLSLPSRLSADVLMMSEEREIEQLIRDAIIEVLNELAEEASNA